MMRRGRAASGALTQPSGPCSGQFTRTCIYGQSCQPSLRIVSEKNLLRLHTCLQGATAVREQIPRVETFDHDVCFVEYGGEMWQVRVEEERCNIRCTCGSMASGTPELNIDIDSTWRGSSCDRREPRGHRSDHLHLQHCHCPPGCLSHRHCHRLSHLHPKRQELA